VAVIGEEKYRILSEHRVLKAMGEEENRHAIKLDAI